MGFWTAIRMAFAALLVHKGRSALTSLGIVIGASAFIGARAFVMPGVTIGEQTLIGAQSVVTKDMPPWTVCAGQPCKPIRHRNNQPSENSPGLP